MKLRLYRDSIRFRLSPGDVDELQRTGRVRESTVFSADNEFFYSIRLSAELADPRALFIANSLTIELPAALARDWSEGDEVGIQHQQKISLERSLTILIEKDFECLDGVEEDSDEAMFPNPKKAC